ncbi:MAG: glycoside hydrolase family 57 protein [Candidatus Brocadiia bacterium]
MQTGYFSLVLHCHLPFVRHPEHDRFFEENWLFEAVTECYLPLLEVMEGLQADGVPLHATVSVSPPLCEMLTDELLQKRCGRYVSRRIELMEDELHRRRGTDFEDAARTYYRHFRRLDRTYGEEAGRSFIDGLRRLQEEGDIEVITSAATHALLPLLDDPRTIAAQVEQGCRCYRRYFGRRPRGLWLPECGWDPHLEGVLAQAGVEFSFLECHGLLMADPPPVHGLFAPLITPSGVAMFGRDVESSKQVWSGDEGYPGDFHYREFHRDLGYDAPYDYIEPYLDTFGERHGLGIKYHRVTGEVSLQEKEPYCPETGRARAKQHAQHFVSERVRQVNEVGREIGRPPVIVSPYDAELFGHWWYEGPFFLDAVFRRLAETPEVQPVTPVGYLDENPVQQKSIPATSSWGFEGYFDVWVNGDNDWIQPRLEDAEEAMLHLASGYTDPTELEERAMDQCARELMLAQSSDWPFLITTDGAADYARRRVEEHLENFWRLHDELKNDSVAETFLKALEGRDNVFPDVTYRLYE